MDLDHCLLAPGKVLYSKLYPVEKTDQNNLEQRAGFEPTIKSFAGSHLTNLATPALVKRTESNRYYTVY